MTPETPRPSKPKLKSFEFVCECGHAASAHNEAGCSFGVRHCRQFTPVMMYATEEITLAEFRKRYPDKVHLIPRIDSYDFGADETAETVQS